MCSPQLLVRRTARELRAAVCSTRRDGRAWPREAPSMSPMGRSRLHYFYKPTKRAVRRRKRQRPKWFRIDSAILRLGSPTFIEGLAVSDSSFQSQLCAPGSNRMDSLTEVPPAELTSFQLAVLTSRLSAKAKIDFGPLCTARATWRARFR